MEELLGIEEFLLALTYGGVVVYVRQQLLKEYRHYTTKGYFKAQQLKKVINNKNDMSLYFTQLTRKQK